MQKKLREQIEGMAAVAKPTQEQLAILVSGWDEYFANMNIVNEVEQEQEFHGIMRARLQSGVISLVAPNKAYTRRAKVGAQKVSSNKKGSAKPARG